MYSIRFCPQSRRQFLRLPAEIRKAIGPRLRRLANWPETGLDVKPLRGELAGSFRLRVGDYRVIFVVDDTAKAISIRKVGHRESVYG